MLKEPRTPNKLLRQFELTDKPRFAHLVKSDAQASQSASERPDVELPSPNEMTKALKQLQQCANDEFLLEHGLKGRGSSKKLAEIKWSAFKDIFNQFHATASVMEKSKYQSMK